jgi:hypothetical protein
MSGKIFPTLFLNVRKTFFRPSPPRSPTFLGKIVTKKNLLQGIIDFCRAILPYTPLIKRG